MNEKKQSLDKHENADPIRTVNLMLVQQAQA